MLSDEKQPCHWLSVSTNQMHQSDGSISFPEWHCITVIGMKILWIHCILYHFRPVVFLWFLLYPLIPSSLVYLIQIAWKKIYWPIMQIILKVWVSSVGLTIFRHGPWDSAMDLIWMDRVSFTRDMDRCDTDRETLTWRLWHGPCLRLTWESDWSRNPCLRSMHFRMSFISDPCNVWMCDWLYGKLQCQLYIMQFIWSCWLRFSFDEKF